MTFDPLLEKKWSKTGQPGYFVSFRSLFGQKGSQMLSNLSLETISLLQLLSFSGVVSVAMKF